MATWLTPWLELGLALVLTTGGYALGCRIWPYGACRRCHGSGKLRAPFGSFGGDATRYCPRCKHTGLRLRPGRRLWAGWRELRQEIHR